MITASVMKGSKKEKYLDKNCQRIVTVTETNVTF